MCMDNQAPVEGEGLKYGGFPKLGVSFGGPYNKDYSILGSIMGYPNFGKLPYHLLFPWKVFLSFSILHP